MAFSKSGNEIISWAELCLGQCSVIQNNQESNKSFPASRTFLPPRRYLARRTSSTSKLFRRSSSSILNNLLPLLYIAQVVYLSSAPVYAWHWSISLTTLMNRVSSAVLPSSTFRPSKQAFITLVYISPILGAMAGIAFCTIHVLNLTATHSCPVSFWYFNFSPSSDQWCPNSSSTMPND